MSKIKLNNRYNKDVYLESVEGLENQYTLRHNSDFIRVGATKGNPFSYDFIDIDGGPMISIGSKFNIGEVKSISRNGRNYVIEIK